MLNYILIVLALQSLLCFAETFKSLGDSTECERKCGISFAPHTYPNPNDDDACKRGCRFYIIDKLIDHSDSNSTVKIFCYNSCVEAYNETSLLTNACKTGCDIEDVISQESNALEEEQNVHILTPFLQVKEVASKIVGMFRIVKSSITTYFLSEDNKVVVVREPLALMVDIVPPQLENSDVDQMISSLQDEPNVFIKKTHIQRPSQVFLFPSYIVLILLIILSCLILSTVCHFPRNRSKITAPLNAPPRTMHINLVRPEDLTKLSLIDEDCIEAGPLPTKVKLPDSTI